MRVDNISLMLMIGIVGDYVGKMYLETKHRPKYIIESVTLTDEVDDE